MLFRVMLRLAEASKYLNISVVFRSLRSRDDNIYLK